MKLSTKILLLVSLPLAFQLGLSFVLFEQLHQSEAKFEKEFHRIRIIAALDQVYHLHVRSLAAAAFYSISKDESVGAKHLTTLKELAGELKQLKELTQNDPGLLDQTTKLQQSVIAVVPYEMMMRKMSLMESKLNLEASTKARRLIKESMQTIESYQAQLIPAADDLTTFRRSAFELEMLLAGALVLILVGSMLFLYWSQKYVLSVISVLIDQIEKFKNGESLQPIIKSKDEIAELELVLCESANRITTLENLRRELCSIVSHDIRAPMTSISGLVTLLEEGVLGKLDAAHESLNKKLKASSTDLLNVLNNILDLDKLRSDKWPITIQSTSNEEVCQRIEKELRTAEFANVQTHHDPGGTVDCDADAISRAFVALAQVFANQTSVIKIECAADGVCTMTIAASEPASDIKIRSAQSLAQLFCEKQKARLIHTASGATSTFAIHLDGTKGTTDELANRSVVRNDSSPIAKRKFSIIGKSLLFLIGRPLAVSFAAIILLGLLLMDIGQELGHEIVAREIVHSTTNLTSDMTHLMLLSIRRTTSSSSAEEEQARMKIETKIDDDMQALRDLESKTHTSMASELELVQKKVDSVKQLSKELTAKPLDQLADTLKQHLAGGDLSSIAFSQAGSLFTSRVEQDSTETLLLSKLRNTEMLVIVGALLASAMLTIFGAIQVSRGLIARLNSVAENARRLTRREPLQKPVGGKDEIANLDTFFFESAHKIAELEQERKELTALLREQLKTPLVFLKDGFSSILAESDNLTEKGKLLIQRTVVEIRRLNDLADDLLILDTIETSGRIVLETEIVDVKINDIVRRAIDAVAPLAKLKNIDIVYGDEKKLTMRGDESRAVQIFVNLLSNAVKFSPEKTAVTVTSEASGNTVKIIVEDKGRGIPASEAHKIFSRFDQVSSEDSRKGSGLGLFISKKLAEAQGGDIGFESTEGVGSKFWLALPLASEV